MTETVRNIIENIEKIHIKKTKLENPIITVTYVYTKLDFK